MIPADRPDFSPLDLFSVFPALPQVIDALSNHNVRSNAPGSQQVTYQCKEREDGCEPEYQCTAGGEIVHRNPYLKTEGHQCGKDGCPHLENPESECRKGEDIEE